MSNSIQNCSIAARLKQLIRDFSDDSGATTVEFVLWVPVFMFILMITVDVSLLFLRQSNMWHVARDVARQASLRIIDTDAELIAAAVAKGTFGGDVPSAAGSSIDTTNNLVQVILRVPMRDVGIFGILNIGGRAISIGQSGNLVAAVTQRLEPE